MYIPIPLNKISSFKIHVFPLYIYLVMMLLYIFVLVSFSVLLKQLVTDHHEGMIEASRVFGNLSRSIDIRNFLTAKKGKF